MTTIPADSNPFHGLAEEASATLRELLAAEGLSNEAPAVLPPFERAIRASVAAVVGSAPADDVTLDFALAYLTGRIAKEQVIALQSALALVIEAGHDACVRQAQKNGYSGDAKGGCPKKNSTSDVLFSDEATKDLFDRWAAGPERDSYPRRCPRARSRRMCACALRRSLSGL